MAARVEKRYGNGLSFNFLYTWSKSLIGGPGSQTISGPGATTYTVGTGPEFYNWNLTKGIGEHRCSASVRRPGHLRHSRREGRRWMNRGGIANMFLGGWTFLTIQSLRTGTPASFANGRQPEQYLQYELLPNVGSGQNINVSNYKIGNLCPEQTQNGFFNINAFAHPAAFTPGNAGIGIARYGGVWRPQYSLTRTIAYHERYKLTVRMDNLFAETHAFLCCNVNNTVNLTSPQLFGKTPALKLQLFQLVHAKRKPVGVLRIDF